LGTGSERLIGDLSGMMRAGDKVGRRAYCATLPAGAGMQATKR
jgi:hypothetical protein